jgi:hypothetical protein
MKKVIVCPTIYPPTEAIEKYDALPDWTLIVVGDQKTPKDYKLKRGLYFSPDEQEKYDPELSMALGWNHPTRRNFGFLLAHDMGADIIASMDDDNIPLPGWGENLLLGQEVKVNMYLTDALVFDPISATNYPHLWHRGFPLELVSKRKCGVPAWKKFKADVQECFWQGDPDIDAVCRMIYAPNCDFDPSLFPLASNRPSPFNTQNTFLSAGVLRDFFNFPGVGNMDDIWASYYAQACGHKVVYGAPSVLHARSPHNLKKDMMSQYQGYENSGQLVQDLGGSPDAIFKYLPVQSVLAFKLYQRHFANYKPKGDIQTL